MSQSAKAHLSGRVVFKRPLALGLAGFNTLLSSRSHTNEGATAAQESIAC